MAKLYDQDYRTRMAEDIAREEGDCMAWEVGVETRRYLHRIHQGGAIRSFPAKIRTGTIAGMAYNDSSAGLHSRMPLWIYCLHDKTCFNLLSQPWSHRPPTGGRNKRSC
jgi:hypothetical protein